VRRLADWDAAALRSLAATHDTPLYVVDPARVRANYRRLRDALGRQAAPDRRVRVAYAAKANCSPAVLDALHSAGAEVEVASAAELSAARAAGFPPERVRYTAVNPPARELDALVRYHRETGGPAAVTAGARDTLDRLADRGYDGPLALRVRPDAGVGHHDGVVTGTDRGFGIALAEADRALAAADRRFDVVGLHAHVGSGVLDDDLDDHGDALARVGAFARQVTAGLEAEDAGGSALDLDLDLEFVDLGGGLGVPYRATEAPLDPGRAAATLLSAVEGVDTDVDAVVEPGRYLAADAGVLLTRVNTVRPGGESETEPTVVGVDAGLHTLVRPAMFDTGHPVRSLAPDAADRPVTRATVVGPVCSSADRLCTARPLARPERGDLVAVGTAGAYGVELASRFHGRSLPTEVAAPDLDGPDGAVDAPEGRVVREDRRGGGDTQ
jgi:diaminopimelate decarboxylase